MNYYYFNTQNAINYIENNLNENLKLERIAAESKFSLYHFYRIFNTLTGMTIKEYIRMRRLSNSAIDIRNSNYSILDIAVKYGFNSQEAFTRAFFNDFNITPGKYRKTKVPIPLFFKIDLIQMLSHRERNGNNLGTIGTVNTYFIKKPARKIIALINPNPQNIHEFYDNCVKNRVFGMLASIKERIFGPFGCWITNPTFTHLVGIEVECGYDGVIPEGMQMIDIRESQYIVFHHSKYNSEIHDSVIKSVWQASEKWNPKDSDMEWNFDEAPIYEDDNEELGYFIYKPVKPIANKV